MVEIGDQRVVDGKMLDRDDIQVDESQITGGSDPKTKYAVDWLYSGSFCLSGSLYYLTEKVGTDSSQQSFSSALSW